MYRIIHARKADIERFIDQDDLPNITRNALAFSIRQKPATAGFFVG
ncbi:MAG: hypothetical protein IBX52_12340 [Bacterioplanes sp.]|nr:hypothetical protein [Bacterioplanes sp.]